MALLVAPGGFSTELRPGKVTLGHGTDVDISLPPNLEVAPVHAELRPLLGGYVLKDLSDGGVVTQVNGQEVPSLRNLSCGDVIRLGKCEITFLLDAEKIAAQKASLAEASNEALPAPTPSTALPQASAATPALTSSAPPLPHPEPEPDPKPPTIPPQPPVAEVEPAPSAAVPAIPPAPANLPPLPPTQALSADETVTAPPPLPEQAIHEDQAFELPPLPANLVSAQPGPGHEDGEETSNEPPSADGPPVESALPPLETTLPVMPSPEAELPAETNTPILPVQEAPQQSPSDVPPEWPSGRAPVDTPEPIRLAPIEQKSSAARRPKLSDYLLPGLVTLIAIAGGVGYLLYHNSKLAQPSESPTTPFRLRDPSNLQSATESAQAAPAEPSDPFTLALERLSKESRQPVENEFPGQNFAFAPPGKEWTLQPALLLPGAQLEYTYDEGRLRLIISGETLGEETPNDNAQLTMIKRRMMAMTPHFQPVNRTQTMYQGLNFQQLTAQARIRDELRYLVNHYLYHNGFFYQVLMIGPSHEQPLVQEMAEAVMPHFQLLDREATTIVPQKALEVDQIADAYYGYRIDLLPQFWKPWEKREVAMPGMHLAVMSTQQSVFGILPMRFEGPAPKVDALAQAFLATLGQGFRQKTQQIEPVSLAEGQGIAITFNGLIENKAATHHYRVIRNGNAAYLLGGWTQNRGINRMREIHRAISKVTFTAPNTKRRPPLTFGQRRAESIVLHQLGLQKVLAGDLDGALTYFQHVSQRHPSHSEIYATLAETFIRLGRVSDGIRFLSERSSQNPSQAVRAALALLQLHSGATEEAASLMADLVAEDYYDIAALVAYVRALTGQGHSGEAMAFVQTFAEKEGQAIEALLTAAILTEKEEHAAGLALLESLRLHWAGELAVASLLVEGYAHTQPARAHYLVKEAQEDGFASLEAFLKGVLAESSGDSEAALAAYQQAVAIEPLKRRYHPHAVRAAAWRQQTLAPPAPDSPQLAIDGELE